MIHVKTKEELAILAEDIANMAQEIIDTKNVELLRNMANNLSNMIRIHDIMIDLRKIGFMAGYDYGLDDSPNRKPWEAWIKWTTSLR